MKILQIYQKEFTPDEFKPDTRRKIHVGSCTAAMSLNGQGLDKSEERFEQIMVVSYNEEWWQLDGVD